MLKHHNLFGLIGTPREGIMLTERHVKKNLCVYSKYNLWVWGESRSTVVISFTVSKHFVHQFNSFVDLLKGYMGKPYLSLS
jgi:hypothetical protein